jgi:hypothetical protein
VDSNAASLEPSPRFPERLRISENMPISLQARAIRAKMGLYER